jgi:hypothetical protein
MEPIAAKPRMHAFPTRRIERNMDPALGMRTSEVSYDGMTLRDYYAIRILQSMITCNSQNTKSLCIKAWKIADEMIEARVVTQV